MHNMWVVAAILVFLLFYVDLVEMKMLWHDIYDHAPTCK